MTRLLMVATVAPTIRGFLLPFADHFRQLGWRVDAMASGVTQCEHCQAGFDQVFEMDWSRNPLAPKNLLSCRAQVRKIVEAEEYDLVHVHTPVAAFVTRLALRQTRRQQKIKVIYTAHGFHFLRGAPLYRNFVFQAFERLGGWWTDRLVVMNEEDFESARRLRIVPEPHLSYMPGIGVDTSNLGPNSVSQQQTEAIRHELDLEQKDSYFLVVAELIPRKRHADVLRAFAQLANNDIHLVLAGDGPLRKDLDRLAQELKIDGRFHSLGFRSDIPALMRGAAALVLTSAQEGLPRSVMEAMCMATPVIGSDIRGTRDLLQDDAGILVPLGDIESLSEAMRRVVAQPEATAAIGVRSRERMGVYDIANVIALHESLYENALRDS